MTRMNADFRPEERKPRLAPVIIDKSKRKRAMPSQNPENVTDGIWLRCFQCRLRLG